jgi:hypothetical protein
LGISVALLMAFFVFLGSKLWAVKKLRKLIKFCNAATVWLPSLFGAGLGAIPVWPRPGPIQDMPEWQGYFSMILMGLICGTFYERIWKFVKERVAAAGIDIELDLPPKEQLKKKAK